jgi:hypothetical protein
VRLLDSFLATHGLTLHHPRTIAAPPRLHLAAEQYHKSIAKKKLSPALDESDKLFPREAFGITMVRHGEDFAGDSVLGNHGIICPISATQ